MRKLDEAFRCLHRSLTVKREVGDRHGEAVTLRRLAGLDAAHGHGLRAREHIELAVAVEATLDAPAATEFHD